jgi:hypothetical protein
MTAISPALEEAIAVELIIILLVARRAYLMYRGVAYSPQRLYLMMALYGFLVAITLAETFSLFPWYATVADLAIVAVTAWLFTGHAASTVIFEGPPGARKYRLPITLVLVYLVLFGIRLALEAGYFPTLIETGVAPAAGTISTFAYVALAVVDALFAFSAGLLIGRSLGVIRAHDRLPGEPPATNALPGDF